MYFSPGRYIKHTLALIYRVNIFKFSGCYSRASTAHALFLGPNAIFTRRKMFLRAFLLHFFHSHGRVEYLHAFYTWLDTG